MPRPGRFPPGHPLEGISQDRQAQRGIPAREPRWLDPADPGRAAALVARMARDDGERSLLLEMLGISDG